jgi:hypothetical protein
LRAKLKRGPDNRQVAGLPALSRSTKGVIVSLLTHQLITTFHHIIRERSGNDVTIARVRSMVALTSLTWPDLCIVVTPYYINPARVMWKSDDIDSFSGCSTFRRDPVGDDASIIIDEDDPKQLVLINEMQECASFIPLFGRQRLERFNLTLAKIFAHKVNGTPLPLPGSEASQSFNCETEYRRLYEWLVGHSAITPDGQWQAC